MQSGSKGSGAMKKWKYWNSSQVKFASVKDAAAVMDGRGRGGLGGGKEKKRKMKWYARSSISSEERSDKGITAVAWAAESEVWMEWMERRRWRGEAIWSGGDRAGARAVVMER